MVRKNQLTLLLCFALLAAPLIVLATQTYIPVTPLTPIFPQNNPTSKFISGGDGNTTNDAGGSQSGAIILSSPGTYNGSIGYLLDNKDYFNITVPSPGTGYTIYVSLDLENATDGTHGYMDTLVLKLFAPNGTLTVTNSLSAHYNVEHRIGLIYTLTSGDQPGSWTIAIEELCNEYCNYWLRFNVSQPVTMSRPTAKWTFMAYLDADIDLGLFAMNVLAAMAGAGSTNNVNIIALIDHPDPSSPDPYTLQAGTWAYYVYKEGVAWLQDFGSSERNMGDPETLKGFVTYVKNKFPAERYALNTWDHGSILGVCFDDSDYDWLEYDEIFRALNETGGVDLIYYFSCMTACLENFYTVSNVTKVAVASEEVMYAAGDYYVFYKDFLENLTSNPTASPHQLGAWIVNAYDQRYTWTIKTIAAVDTSKMAELYAALNETAKLLDIQTLNQTWINNIQQALQNVEKYPSNVPHRPHELVDLYDLMDKLAQNIGDQRLQELASNVKNTISSAITAEAHGSNHTNSHGMAIYHPTNALNLYGYYFVTSFSLNNMWDDYLLHFFNSQYHQTLDYDGDGLTNAQEYQLGTNAYSNDTDGDGMPDGWEVQYGLDPKSDDASQDRDNDGFTNLEEYRAGTDPTDASSVPTVPTVPIVYEGLSPTVVAVILLVSSQSQQSTSNLNLVLGLVGGLGAGVVVGAVVVRRI